MLSFRVALLVVMLLASTSSASAQSRPPNVIVILADDLGWTDLGCYGSKYYETPHLDRLAKRGMRFTHAYSAGPNCTPTRAALMTGQYGPRSGVYTVGSGARGAAKDRKLTPVENVTQLPLDRQTVAQAMKGLGYQTGIFGKWHLGEKKQHHPAARGFDEAITSMGKHFDFNTNPKIDVEAGTYLADFLTDQAIQFMGRNKDRPFFLYLSHFGVHTPLEAKTDLVKRFEKKKGVGGHDNPTYAAMIASVDESVGRVVAALEKLKLTENTILIFSSDNGGVGGYAAAGVNGARDITNNAPLRGGKGMLYEGGVRVVWIVSWPGHVPTDQTNDEPIISVDLFPTLVELGGGKGKKIDQPLDGVSLVPLFKGKTIERQALFWHFPGYLEAGAKGKGKDWRTTPAGSIRVGEWKLIEFFEDNRLELYNLKSDPGQNTNLAKTMPERTRQLHERLQAWRTEVRAPMPGRKK